MNTKIFLNKALVVQGKEISFFILCVHDIYYRQKAKLGFNVILTFICIHMMYFYFRTSKNETHTEEIGNKSEAVITNSMEDISNLPYCFLLLLNFQ